MALQRIASLCLICWLSMGGSEAVAEPLHADFTIPESYPKDYIFSLISMNQAIGLSHQELEGHLNSPGLSYQHRLTHPWVVSVGYRPQSFINRRLQRPLSLLTFSNATQRIMRLYHPFYLLVGTEVLYLIPVQKINPPIEKDPNFTTEIGLGARLSLWYLWSQNNLVFFDFERWRGTKTDRLHGMTLSLGLGWGFH